MGTVTYATTCQIITSEGFLCDSRNPNRGSGPPQSSGEGWAVGGANASLRRPMRCGGGQHREAKQSSFVKNKSVWGRKSKAEGFPAGSAAQTHRFAPWSRKVPLRTRSRTVRSGACAPQTAQIPRSRSRGRGHGHGHPLVAAERSPRSDGQHSQRQISEKFLIFS